MIRPNVCVALWTFCKLINLVHYSINHPVFSYAYTSSHLSWLADDRNPSLGTWDKTGDLGWTITARDGTNLMVWYTRAWVFVVSYILHTPYSIQFGTVLTSWRGRALHYCTSILTLSIANMLDDLTRLPSKAIKPESTSSLDCSYCQSDFCILKTRIIIKKTFVQVLYIPSTMFMEDAADTGAPVGSQGGDQRILSHSIYCLCTHPHSMQWLTCFIGQELLRVVPRSG